MDRAPSAATATPGSAPVEAIIAGHVARRAVWVAPVLIGFFGLVGGLDGAAAAAIGVAVVVANFLLSDRWVFSLPGTLRAGGGS